MGVEAKELEHTAKMKEMDNAETEIDLLAIGGVLLDRIRYIILFGLLGALLLGAYVYLTVEPTYESTSKLYIVSASEDSVVNLSDLNIGSSLTADYQELILSYPLLDQVIEKIGLDMDYKQLLKMISLSNPSDSRILCITVTSTDPEEACEIANTIAEISCQYLPETMSTREPNIAQVAKVATEQAGPSYLKYVVIGGLLAVVIYCGIIIVQFILDDTIHTAEDLEKAFDIVPLTVVPESEEFRSYDGRGDDENGNKMKRRKRKGKKSA